MLVADENDLCYSVDTDRDGWIQVNYEQFMKVGIAHPSRDALSFLTQSDGSDRTQRSLRVLSDSMDNDDTDALSRSC